MTELERMKKGLLYNPMDEEIFKLQLPYLDKIVYFNSLKPSQLKEKEAYLKEVFAECGDNCYIELPFRANWGGHHVHFGNHVYANYNLTLVDDGHIYVGDDVMFGPNVTVATANHPLEASLRKKGYQYNRDVHIGNNTWICANVVIVPGINIGSNSVIGAGSVVVKDIPDNVLACGNPCKIIRTIGDKEKEFYYKNDRIDWENLGGKND